MNKESTPCAWLVLLGLNETADMIYYRYVKLYREREEQYPRRLLLHLLQKRLDEKD